MDGLTALPLPFCYTFIAGEVFDAHMQLCVALCIVPHSPLPMHSPTHPNIAMNNHRQSS